MTVAEQGNRVDNNASAVGEAGLEVRAAPAPARKGKSGLIGGCFAKRQIAAGLPLPDSEQRAQGGSQTLQSCAVKIGTALEGLAVLAFHFCFSFNECPGRRWCGANGIRMT